MRRSWRDGGAALLAIVVLASCAGAPRQQGEATGAGTGQAATTPATGDEAAVVLDSATISRIGLRTVVLARSERAPEIELPAEVVEDPGATTMVRAGVGGRLTEAAGRTWPRVGDRLAAGEEIAQVGDARPLLVPHAGTVTRLLAQPGELVQAGQTLLELVDFGSALVRIAWDGSGVRPPPTVALSALGGGARLQGHLQGVAQEADPVTRGPAWLYRVSAGDALRPGASLVAHLPDPRGARGGVLLPSEAVVQWDALAWAFVERAPGRFVRVQVPTDLVVPGGWLVEHGFVPGERVVVTGAGQLLSEEFRARITVGQEVGE